MISDLTRIWLLLILGGFLVGGIMFAYLLPMLLLKKDICVLSDDHNPGTANVFKHCGTAMGLCCLALDLAKGFLPVFLAIRFADDASPLFILVMIAPVLAHALAPFNRFPGGKCIATIFGETLALLWVTPTPFTSLALLYILFSTLIKIQPNSKRSIVTFLLSGGATFVILLFGGKQTIAIGCLAVSLIAVWKHSRRRSQAVQHRYCVAAETE